MRVAVSFLLLVAGMSGCVSNDGATTADGADGVPLLDGFGALASDLLPQFSIPAIVDDVRAGGEPVIAVTHEGTILVSAHPGWTHYHPSDDPAHPGAELLTPASAQSYLWRSTDNGTTWTHIGLPGSTEGPRSTGFGVSDPEFTVMDDNTVCYTDLMALATSSVVCSTDDGLTWLPGNELASGGVNDRQWLASYGDELYFTASYIVSTTGFGGHHIRASTDRGLTWEDRGEVPCSQDLIADRATGFLYVGCDAGISVSEDAGWTWSEVRSVPDAVAGQRVMAEPGIDSAGNVWVTWATGERAVWVAGTPDDGLTWPWVFNLSDHFALYSTFEQGDHDEGEHAHHEATTGTVVWPWLSAGSDGRVAVSWIGAFEEAESATYEGPWYMFTAFVIDATADVPSVTIKRLTPEPIHEGPICQSGTVCQASSMAGSDSGDRRLGDFFETTIDHDGMLHGVWSNTYERQEDVVSHVQYVKQEGGISLIADDELGAWTPTQG